jgi:casein kinase II subunit beta
MIMVVIVEIDGAFFGTSFPHVFLLNYPELMVNHVDHFEPKIYGYKIHESR